jgi:hypothetical protein
MGCLGVLFSLDEDTVNRLKSFNNDNDRLDYLQEEIEEYIMDEEPEQCAELNKAWDALHRSLTDGKLEHNNGEFPLNHVILGGEILYYADDYIMTLKTPEQVKVISQAIDGISKAQLRKGYDKIDGKYYGHLSDADFDDTWESFQESVVFWKRAAEQKRYVLFTADQ